MLKLYRAPQAFSFTQRGMERAKIDSYLCACRQGLEHTLEFKIQVPVRFSPQASQNKSSLQACVVKKGCRNCLLKKPSLALAQGRALRFGHNVAWIQLSRPCAFSFTQRGMERT